MRILVCGARGQVGSELTALGQTMGHSMIAAGHADLDITRPLDVQKFVNAQNPDIIINAAAYTAVDNAEKDIETAYAINRDGPANLALACRKQDIPLLHLSTDYVFDGVQEHPYVETDPTNPLGIYGKSKLAGENALKGELTKYLIMRVSWVFGATGQNFVRTMLRLAKQHGELRVVSDQQGNPTWSADIASALLAIAERHHTGSPINWGTYHFTGSPSTNWYDFAKIIFEYAVRAKLLDKAPILKAITSEEYPTRAPRPQHTILNCDKIREVLGIVQADWRLGLEAVLNRWKAL